MKPALRKVATVTRIDPHNGRPVTGPAWMFATDRVKDQGAIKERKTLQED